MFTSRTWLTTSLIACVVAALPAQARAAEESSPAPAAAEQPSAAPAEAPAVEPSSSEAAPAAEPSPAPQPAPEPAAAAAPAATSDDALLQSMEQIGQMSLSDILGSATTVATKGSAQKLREAPGILTVITRDEIVGTGARDLLDILNRVPGLSFSQDTAGQIGLGVRGNWAFEGKALLLVDGHEMNETLYLAAFFGDHIPADIIERVEVIRGPGSVVYGGMAELAVINVTTRRADSLDGLSASARLSLLPDSKDLGRRQVNLSWGDTFQLGNPLKVSVTASVGESKQSGADQVDVFGDSFSMGSNSSRRPTLFTLNASWSDLQLSFLYDDWSITDRTAFGENLSRAVETRAPGVYAWLSYDLKLPLGFTLLPKVRFKQQKPWNNLVQDDGIKDLLYYDVTAQRWEGSLALSWRHFEWLEALAGAAYTHDHAWLNTFQEEIFPDGAQHVSYSNVAAFAEITGKTVVDLTAGARYEHHSLYGDSFVPRGAITGVFGDFHAKLLAAQAFKAPGIENIATNLDIQPERTTAFELELGYLITKDLLFTVNGFYLSIDKPIVYTFDTATNTEGYFNGDTAGTCGVEAELRYRGKKHWATASYSFYSAACSDQPAEYQVAGDSSSVLGQANHKVSVLGSIELTKGLRVSPSVLVFSGRTFVEFDADENLVYQKVEPAVLVDLWVSYKPPVFKGFSLSLGVNNLLDSRFDLIQPYPGGKPPMRALDREIGLRLGYDTL